MLSYFRQGPSSRRFGEFNHVKFYAEDCSIVRCRLALYLVNSAGGNITLLRQKVEIPQQFASEK